MILVKLNNCIQNAQPQRTPEKSGKQAGLREAASWSSGESQTHRQIDKQTRKQRTSQHSIVSGRACRVRGMHVATLTRLRLPCQAERSRREAESVPSVPKRVKTCLSTVVSSSVPMRTLRTTSTAARHNECNQTPLSQVTGTISPCRLFGFTSLFVPAAEAGYLSHLFLRHSQRCVVQPQPMPLFLGSYGQRLLHRYCTEVSQQVDDRCT